jgi:hypothetical protein
MENKTIVPNIWSYFFECDVDIWKVVHTDYPVMFRSCTQFYEWDLKKYHNDGSRYFQVVSSDPDFISKLQQLHYDIKSVEVMNVYR